MFSPQSVNWGGSLLGRNISCMAVCEYINHPEHLKKFTENRKHIPHKYYIVTNNEIVRVRYLLVYASGPGSQLFTPRNAIMNWFGRNKMSTIFGVYMMLLVCIGFYNGSYGSYLRHILYKKATRTIADIQQFFQSRTNTNQL